jgi:hypothetical protein
MNRGKTFFLMSGLKLQKDFEAFLCDKSHADSLNQNLLL